MTFPGGKSATQTRRVRRPPQRSGPGTPDSGRNTRAVLPASRMAVWRGHGVSGQRHLREAHAQSWSRDKSLTSHRAASIPLGRKDFVLKRVHAWPAGHAFERSSSDLLTADPRGAGRLLLRRPPPSSLHGTTRKRAQHTGDPLLNQSQGSFPK